MGQNIYMLPSDMNLTIKTGTVRYNNKIIVFDGNFSLGKNDEVMLASLNHKRRQQQKMLTKTDYNSQSGNEGPSTTTTEQGASTSTSGESN